MQGERWYRNNKSYWKTHLRYLIKLLHRYLYPKALCFCNLTETPPPGLSKRGMPSTMPFYSDIKVMLPLIIATAALVAAAIIVAIRWRNSESKLMMHAITFQCFLIKYFFVT